jgi:hypothetical protein
VVLESHSDSGTTKIKKYEYYKFLDKDVLDYWEVKDVSTPSDKFELNGDV